MFQRLVTPERTRDVVDISELEELGDPGEVRRLIDQLIDARLLVVQRRGDADAPAVELVHESMIASWPTLRRWLNESEEDAAVLADLRIAAKQWDAHQRSRDLLWRGESLDQANRWRERYRGQIPSRGLDFLDASISLAARTARIRRATIYAAFTVLIGLVAAAAVALVLIRNAEQEAVTAEHASAEAAATAQKEAARAGIAERRVSEQLTQLKEETRAKAEAQLAKAAAERRASEASSKVAEGVQALKLTYGQLQEALASAEAQKRKAEKSADDALETAMELSKANTELEVKIREETRRRLAAERATAKAKAEISTTLD